MSPRSILITGCSSGIGYDAAHGLAARGWRVFATCRAEADCARLRAEGLTQGEVVERLGKRYKLGRSAIYNAIGAAE